MLSVFDKYTEGKVTKMMQLSKSRGLLPYREVYPIYFEPSDSDSLFGHRRQHEDPTKSQISEACFHLFFHGIGMLGVCVHLQRISWCWK